MLEMRSHSRVNAISFCGSLVR